jgi:hypothetical protein
VATSEQGGDFFFALFMKGCLVYASPNTLRGSFLLDYVLVKVKSTILFFKIENEQNFDWIQI